jgi:DNA repair protein RadD
MKLSHYPEHKVFVFHCSREEWRIPGQMGFVFNRPVLGRWATKDLLVAGKAIEYADQSAREVLDSAVREKSAVEDQRQQTVAREMEEARRGTFKLRPYQQEASDRGVEFFRDKSSRDNALMILGTGSGKSIVIADIADKLNEPVLVFQPSKEILEQNYRKYCSYGRQAGIYSASVGVKRLAGVTFAMIGSVIRKTDMLHGFPNIIVDECHGISAKGGMYKTLLDTLKGVKVLGLTATPYRLNTDGFGGSMLKFLTRTRPRIFSKVIYYIQNQDLFDQGYLAKLKYTRGTFDRRQLKLNTTGAEFADWSVRHVLRGSGFKDRLVARVREVLASRKNALIFTSFVEESEYLTQKIPGVAIVTAKTPKHERAKIVNDFRNGKIRAAANVGVLSTGFDHPELETIVMARPTMSLALYYQQIGRGIRPHPNKEYCEIVDLVDNYSMFGPVESLKIVEGENGKWFISNNGKQLTNVYYGERAGTPDYL